MWWQTNRKRYQLEEAVGRYTRDNVNIRHLKLCIELYACSLQYSLEKSR